MVTIKLKINNTEYTSILGLYLIGELIESTKLDYDKLLKAYELNPFKYMPLFWYYSVKSSLELDGRDIEFSKSDFYGWIEDDGGIQNKELVKFGDAFVRSLTKDVPVEEEKKGAKKK